MAAMPAILEPDQVQSLASGAAGSMASVLANRSTDTLRRRAADFVAGAFLAMYGGPMLAKRLGVADDHDYFAGVCFTIGIVGALIVNRLYKKFESESLWDWARSLIGGTKPGLFLVFSLLGLSGLFNQARAQEICIPQPMPAPPAMKASDRPAGFLARPLNYLSHIWEVLRGK